MTAKQRVSKGDEEQQAPENFEQALERLEKIVADMENGSLKLEEMIACFEQGQALIGFCTRKLNEVERKIEVLVKQGQELATEPFEDDADTADEESGDELF